MRPAPRPPATDRLETALGKLVGTSQPDVDIPLNWTAHFDVKETSGELTLIIDLPGVDEDEISIEATNGFLEVSAERVFDHDTEDAEEYTQLSRPYGVFSCSVPLPPDADANGVTAKYKRGVLKVRVPIHRAQC